MNYLNTLLFGYYPYVAISVFIIGSWPVMTVINTPGAPVPANCYARKNYAWAVTCFISVYCCCLSGHFCRSADAARGLSRFGSVYLGQQILAVVAGGVFGGVCARGIIILIRRRLTDARIRATSSRMDIFILLLDRCAVGVGPTDLADFALSQ